MLAERLGVSVQAVDTAKTRLRQRYKKTLVKEIADTLDNPKDLDDEIRSLFDAIRPEPKKR